MGRRDLDGWHEEAVALRRTGKYSLAQIGDVFGVTRQAVDYVVKKAGLKGKHDRREAISKDVQVDWTCVGCGVEKAWPQWRATQSDYCNRDCRHAVDRISYTCKTCKKRYTRTKSTIARTGTSKFCTQACKTRWSTEGPQIGAVEVRALLLRRGWTHVQLAGRLGVTKDAICLWLSGAHIGRENRELLAKLARKRAKRKKVTG